jgi:hypothetical protein
MQRILKIITESIEYTNIKDIENYLYSSPFYWILDCELDNVILEIKDNILYFKSGIFYWGIWYWGVFENGEFRSGDWNGGIFFNGLFKGNWKNGVWKGGTFKGKGNIE